MSTAPRFQLTTLLASLLVSVVAVACSASQPAAFPDVGEIVTLDGGDVALSASLLLPRGPGPFPAFVGLVGSGAYTYRDAWIDGHWAFWKELAEVLNAQGLGLLLLEKRGVAGSAGSWKERTLEQRAADALAAVRYLKGRKEVDPGRVGVVGQSQGGWVAQIAAARAPDEVAFVVTFAGPATPVLEQVVDDRESELRCDGLSPDVIVEKRTKYESRLRRFGGMGHLRRIRDYDPAADLREIRQPMLAIFGENDELVWPEKNVALLREAFSDSGNTRLWTHVVAGANHAFLYGEPCEALEGHDGPPAFESALLDPEFFEASGLSLVPKAR